MHYFYPRPPRGGRQTFQTRSIILSAISTHALREEGDSKRRTLTHSFGISTHALREEGDALTPEDPEYQDIFLPTPSARRATWKLQM